METCTYTDLQSRYTSIANNIHVSSILEYRFFHLHFSYHELEKLLPSDGSSTASRSRPRKNSTRQEIWPGYWFTVSLPRIDRRYRGRVFDLVASGEGPWITYSLVSALDVGDLAEEGEGSPLENDCQNCGGGKDYLVENPFFFPSRTCPLWNGNILNSLFKIMQRIFFSFWRYGRKIFLFANWKID